MRLMLERDGALRIFTALAAPEPWLAELFRRQAARLLELEPGLVRVEPADTRDLPPGSVGSVGRALGPGLRLLEQCCRDLRRRGRPGTVTRRAAGGRAERSMAATVTEVEADPATLQLRCRRLWLVVDAGRVEEEPLCRAFAGGEALRALGRAVPSLRAWAPAREPASAQPALAAAALAAPPGGQSGLMPLPELHVHFLKRGGRTRYRAWERLPGLGVAPALAAAASQATGLFLDRLPLSPEVIQQCLESE